MKQITINTFEFKELNPEIKSKVLDDNRDINVSDEWYDFALDDLESKIKENLNLNISRDKVYFDIFAKTSFCKLDIGEVSKALSQKYPKLINIDLPNFFGVTAYWSLRKSDFGNDIIELETEHSEDEGIERETEEVINEEIKSNILKDLTELQEIILQFFKGLYEDYDYLTSDESIKETFEANDYTFEETGAIV